MPKSQDFQCNSTYFRNFLGFFYHFATLSISLPQDLYKMTIFREILNSHKLYSTLKGEARGQEANVKSQPTPMILKFLYELSIVLGVIFQGEGQDNFDHFVYMPIFLGFIQILRGHTTRLFTVTLCHHAPLPRPHTRRGGYLICRGLSYVRVKWGESSQSLGNFKPIL